MSSSSTTQAGEINIEQIREKLKTWQYKGMEEFSSDMNLMFQNWLRQNSADHKYYKTFLAIEDRFNKSIERARQKLQDAEDKQKVHYSKIAL